MTAFKRIKKEGKNKRNDYHKNTRGWEFINWAHFSTNSQYPFQTSLKLVNASASLTNRKKQLFKSNYTIPPSSCQEGEFNSRNHRNSSLGASQLLHRYNLQGWLSKIDASTLSVAVTRKRWPHQITMHFQLCLEAEAESRALSQQPPPCLCVFITSWQADPLPPSSDWCEGNRYVFFILSGSTVNARGRNLVWV